MAGHDDRGAFDYPDADLDDLPIRGFGRIPAKRGRAGLFNLRRVANAGNQYDYFYNAHHRMKKPGVSGLGAAGVWSILTGKGSEWYSHLDQVQKSLAVLNAEVGVIGQSVWDAVVESVRAGVSAGAPYIRDFASVQDQVTSFLAGDSSSYSIRVSDTYVPSDDAISRAEATATEIRAMVEYVKGVDAQVKAEADAAAAKRKADLSKSTLQSPADVGEEVFKQQVAAQAAAIGGWSVGVLAIVAVGLLGLGLVMRK